jgi:hypothetical protein
MARPPDGLNVCLTTGNIAIRPGKRIRTPAIAELQFSVSSRNFGKSYGKCRSAGSVGWSLASQLQAALPRRSPVEAGSPTGGFTRHVIAVKYKCNDP